MCETDEITRKSDAQRHLEEFGQELVAEAIEAIQPLNALDYITATADNEQRFINALMISVEMRRSLRRI